MAGSTDEIEGVVLCRVGDHQLAFPAVSVGSIEAWELGGVPAPLARTAFGLAAVAGKLLVRGGFSLVVDALEVLTEPAKLLPVPALLIGSAGGSLRGFVIPHAPEGQKRDVVPLLGLAEFSRWVSAKQVAE